MTRLFAGTPFDIPPTCDRCGKAEEECGCPPIVEDKSTNYLPPDKQSVKVRVDRRKHKRLATVVWGLSPAECDLDDLLSKLKSACGCGGSIQDEQIELQGDHLDRVKTELKRIGFRVGA